MKVVGLVSGGKDSSFAMIKCVQYGHEIVALANLMPADDSVDELDSYMYQTVGHQMVVSYSKCMGVPLFRRRIQGSTRSQDLSYDMTPGDEVEDMFVLLSEVKRQIPSVVAVSTGAIASDYQRLRVESVCSRLGLVSLAYLWKQDQSLLLQEMIASGIVAILVKVAAIGLDPSKHLGKKLEYMKPYLHKLKELYGVNVCGEGGEYETLTLDCPLFKNARIILDESQIVLHSSDSIAPVGILHPLSFHVEIKQGIVSANDSYSSPGSLTESESVHEVLGDCFHKYEDQCQSAVEDIFIADNIDKKLFISKSVSHGTFSISCWLQDSCKTSADLEEDLKAVLMKIEMKLLEYGFSWEHALYIHLYLADMKSFALANEVYVRFITQKKCRLGVPSRCTIELPLLEAGLGRVYAEVLVANDNIRRVLHVQSVSCWAPSCIGPYSQATLHKEILYMAGQLGLDPPTMSLCGGGATAELEQALENCEAVAQCFRSSITTSAIFFVVYCSMSVPTSERISMEDKYALFLRSTKSSHLDNTLEGLDPIFLYILVPDLPKSALVEVKPILYAGETQEPASDGVTKDLSKMERNYWGFQHEDWHDFCLQKRIVHGKICAALLAIVDEIAKKICFEPTSKNQDSTNSEDGFGELKMERIVRFCIYYLDKVLVQHSLAWNDILVLRIYYQIRLQISHGTLSHIFTRVLEEFAGVSGRLEVGKGKEEESRFNLVPVLEAGSSATSMDNIITCELLARKC